MRAWLLLPLLLAGCGLFRKPAPAPVAPPRYVVGPAYQAGGLWFYPREQFGLEATGLAVVLPDGPGLTANGERRDAAGLAGSHDTLQLPAIARVTNLDTGLQVVVRINDRGPATPGRLIGLSRRAADRLGIPPGATARVRLQVEDGPSQALRDALQGAGTLVAAAPRGAVLAEALAPPTGTVQSSRGRVAATARPVVMGTPAEPDLLPDTVIQVGAAPGQLFIRAGEFGQAALANQVRARLPGPAVVERVRQGRYERFLVRAGPFSDVVQADIALDQAIRAGVTDAHIVVE